MTFDLSRKLPALAGSSNPCVRVPATIALCPECGGRVVVSFIAYGDVPNAGSLDDLLIYCDRDERGYTAAVGQAKDDEEFLRLWRLASPAEHDWTGVHWKPTNAKVTRWVALGMKQGLKRRPLRKRPARAKRKGTAHA